MQVLISADHESLVEHSGWTELQLTLPAGGSPDLPDGAQMLSADLLGTAEEIGAMEEALGLRDVPVTRVISTAEGCGGMQLVAAWGAPVRPICFEDVCMGTIVEAGPQRHLYLGGITASDPSAPRVVQTKAVFSQIEKALRSVSMSFADVARTWFYNDHILDWYPEFNSVRTSYFNTHHVRRMPASTGIGAANPEGNALVAKVWAVTSQSPGLMRAAASPLQCDAFAYGSAFSRAMLIQEDHVRTLLVSGTAAILPDGQSAHPGDTSAQIDLTMQVVDALIRNAGFSLDDTTQALLYFRNPDEIPLWQESNRHLPALAIGADVCRDDLLFEIELELNARV